MSAETLTYLDAIKHLPEGGTLHLQDVSWEEYEELVERRDEVSHVRLSYDEGRLEIMSPSAEHERYRRDIGVEEAQRPRVVTRERWS